jgi:hypothetical protein
MPTIAWSHIWRAPDGVGGSQATNPGSQEVPVTFGRGASKRITDSDTGQGPSVLELSNRTSTTVHDVQGAEVYWERYLCCKTFTVFSLNALVVANVVRIAVAMAVRIPALITFPGTVCCSSFSLLSTRDQLGRRVRCALWSREPVQ